MNYELETILDACVNEIEEGTSSINECLERYPQHAAQLKPLLTAATKLARGREIVPDPAYRARARTRLNVYMQQHPQHKRISPVFWRFSIAFAAVMLLFIASGTAFAQGARPGDALYNLKLTSENVWRFTSSDQLGVDLALADRRMNELLWASNTGDQMRRERAVKNYEKLLIQFNAEQNPKAQQRIVPVLKSQHELLREAGISVPELEIYFPR